jgi:hypothetical protein
MPSNKTHRKVLALCTIHREDRVCYKGLWGTLVLIEDGLWTSAIEKILAASSAIQEVVDYAFHKLDRIYGCTANQTDERAKLIFFPDDDDRPPMKLLGDIPIFQAGKLFAYVEENGKMPTKAEFDNLMREISIFPWR